MTDAFNRALSRIISRRNASVAAKTFAWVAVAKRPLTLEELREAISIEICQPHSMPERLVNGIDRLALWCENLVRVDEELKTVQFAHQAIHKFLTEEPTQPEFKDFHINPTDADHHAGEICVTYLNFNDFKTTLARRPQPITPIDPVAMAKVALSHEPNVSRAIPSFGFGSRRQKSKAAVAIPVAVSGSGGEESRRRLEQNHPFLDYASTHWMSHTARLREDSVTWHLWHGMVTCGHDLAKLPWPQQHEFNPRDPALLKWSSQSRHFAFLRLLDTFGGISNADRHFQMWASAESDDPEMLDVLLGGSCPLPSMTLSTCEMLPAASRAGHLKLVERFLSDGSFAVPDNLDVFGMALQEATKGGHAKVVQRLLTAGANSIANNFNNSPRFCDLALRTASGRGFLEVVNLFLEAGVEVNWVAVYSEQTALQAASEAGHLDIVRRLLEAGADADDEPADVIGGLTALQAAAKNGHLDVVELLLVEGANPNAYPAEAGGQTALQAASEHGHVEVVKRLLVARAKVNAFPAVGGQTALEAASTHGRLEVVKLLLAAGADVHRLPALLDLEFTNGNLEILIELKKARNEAPF